MTDMDGQESKDWCLNVGKELLLALKNQINGLEKALNCDDDIHQQTAYLMLKTTFEFMQDHLPKLVGEQMANLYPQEDLSTKSVDKPV